MQRKSKKEATSTFGQAKQSKKTLRFRKTRKPKKEPNAFDSFYELLERIASGEYAKEQKGKKGTPNHSRSDDAEIATHGSDRKDDYIEVGPGKWMTQEDKELERRYPVGKWRWVTSDKPNVCSACAGRNGTVFHAFPRRPHPLCRCRIELVSECTEDRQLAFGFLAGHDDRTEEVFHAGPMIEVEITCLGMFFGGVHVTANGKFKETGHMRPGKTMTLTFESKDLVFPWEQDTLTSPVPWEVVLHSRAADNTRLMYTIRSRCP